MRRDPVGGAPTINHRAAWTALVGGGPRVPLVFGGSTRCVYVLSLEAPSNANSILFGPICMSKPARILVADHEVNSLENIEAALRSSGYQTDRAKTGPEALEQVARFRPDLCIIDPMIPGIDGFTVSQQITRRNPSIRVIISTGIYKGDQYRRDARAKYGASDYLEKPYDDQRLLSVVRALLEPEQVGAASKDMTRELEEMLENSLDKIEQPALVRPGGDAASRLFAAKKTAIPKPETPVAETMRVDAKDLQREMAKIKQEMASLNPSQLDKSSPPESSKKNAGPTEGGVFTSSDIFGALIKDIEEGKVDEREFTLSGQNQKKKEKADEAIYKTQPAPPLEERAIPGPRLSSNSDPLQKSGANEYQLLSKIASGGMAEVWKAKLIGEKGFEKIVAVKKILPHLSANEEFITMFTDEAKVAAKLTHPNIAQIYELKIGDPSFIAMEYVSGHTLRRALNQSKSLDVVIPVEMVAFIGMKLCNALHYAHNKRDFDNTPLNIVHRDVSPQNILISSDGEIKLVDFGIAKASIKATETVAGSLKGKLQYMSPEQGDGQNIDLRSDIFSLANVLYEALTNRKLFDGNSELAILKKVREGDFPRVREINPSVPEPLEAILLRALTISPEQRYESAKLFEADLKDFLMEKQVTRQRE